MDNASFRQNYFRPALAAAKLPDMRVHDLRHTAASLWLAAGFQPYEVSRWLGHSSVTTTDTIYAHLYATDYTTHVARFDAFVTEQHPVSDVARKLLSVSEGVER